MADEKPEYPVSMENCQNVVIGDAEEALQEVLSCGLEIVVLNMKARLFNREYILICDIEPYPELEGKWFYGECLYADAQGNRVAMTTTL